MDRLSLLETFTVAVEQGSLNRAARHRGLTQSAVSQQIKHLEDMLGYQLLHRTARGVQLTRSGEIVYEQALPLLSGFDGIAASLDALHDSYSGPFRISVSTVLGRAVVGPILMELQEQHPDLGVVMKVEDRLVDVVREDFDLAIRTGKLGETEGIGRKIGSIETMLFASPEYLDRMGRPETPDDLRNLKYIQHNEDQQMEFFRLIRSGKSYRAPLQVGFTADDVDLIKQAVLAGTGFSRAPMFYARDLYEAGKVERVLPDYCAPDKDVFAVYSSRKERDHRRDLVITRIQDALAACREAHIVPEAQPATAITA